MVKSIDFVLTNVQIVMRRNNLKVGCCGWSRLDCKKYFGNGWKDKFKSKLEAYSKLYSVVEVNSTFYKLPSIKTAEKWRSQVPEIFEFTVKAHQIITHKDRFKTDVSINAFKQTLEVAKALKAKFILLQCPASWKATESNIRDFKRFLRNVNNRIAWEPRGWVDKPEKVKELCEEFNIIHCVDLFRSLPCYGKIGYFRLHGLGKRMMYDYKFSDEELKWVRKILDKINVKQGYIFFNNIFMYEDALRFLRWIKTI